MSHPHTSCIFAIVLAAAAGGCSDAATDPLPEGPSSASFTVSGAVEGEWEGFAEFRTAASQSLDPPIRGWFITLSDVDPGTDYPLFVLNIRGETPESHDRIEPGTYTIGNDPTWNHIVEDVWGAEFQERATYFPWEARFKTSDDTGGTLVITESTEHVLAGTFEFRAVRTGRTNEGEIVVREGEFVAHAEDR